MKDVERKRIEEYKQRMMKKESGKEDDTVREAVSKKKGIKPWEGKDKNHTQKMDGALQIRQLCI